MTVAVAMIVTMTMIVTDNYMYSDNDEIAIVKVTATVTAVAGVCTPDDQGPRTTGQKFSRVILHSTVLICFVSECWSGSLTVSFRQFLMSSRLLMHRITEAWFL